MILVGPSPQYLQTNDKLDTSPGYRPLHLECNYFLGGGNGNSTNIFYFHPDGIKGSAIPDIELNSQRRCQSTFSDLVLRVQSLRVRSGGSEMIDLKRKQAWVGAEQLRISLALKRSSQSYHQLGCQRALPVKLGNCRTCRVSSGVVKIQRLLRAHYWWSLCTVHS